MQNDQQQVVHQDNSGVANNNNNGIVPVVNNNNNNQGVYFSAGAKGEKSVGNGIVNASLKVEGHVEVSKPEKPAKPSCVML